jgi:hypothetical protein
MVTSGFHEKDNQVFKLYSVKMSLRKYPHYFTLSLLESLGTKPSFELSEYPQKYWEKSIEDRSTLRFIIITVSLREYL